MKWPFSKPAPVVETKADTSGYAVPADWLFELFGAGAAGSSAVSAATALTVPAVQAAVRVISEAAASLDVTVKRKVGDAEVDVPEHPAAKLLTGAANPWTSGYEIIRDLVSEALTHDAGGFAWVNRVSGRPAEVIHYDPGSIGVAYSTKGTGEPTYRLSGKKINSADVIHLRGPFSKCPLTLARQAIGLAHLMESHASNLWLNGGSPKGVIETPKKVGDDGIRKMITAWRAAHDGPANAGKTAILFDEATYKQLALSSTDGQFLENRQFQILEIARAFRVPPGMLFELTRNTWGNSEQQAKEFISYTLVPWIRSLEAALNRALFTDSERGEYRIAFDIDDTSQADLTARATAISSLIASKVLNPNEARDWLGLEPRAGGEVYENPAITVAPAANDNNQPKQEAA
ncbi:phage portal protein [Phyllobacterium sp. SB3]|uniref:phage portal protein n=1 Tax=Phyllobacterium sp. SB3 TaxID=3156073 RepID=UPI0032AFA1B7